MPTTIVWFRRDMRLADNPALRYATGRGPVVPVYILAPREESDRPPGRASQWWLHRSLQALSASLLRHGVPLVIRRADDSLGMLRQLLRETGADSVVWNRLYEPMHIDRDRKIMRQLRELGTDVRSFNAALLCEPWTVKKKDGGPYRAFTPYWRAASGDACSQVPETAAGPILGLDTSPDGLEPGAPDLFPDIPRDRGFHHCWRPGEAGAHARLHAFLERALDGYGVKRNRPAEQGTSGLSPHLHFGEIGPRQIVAALRQRLAEEGSPRADGERFLSELGWREFAHHLLYHHPDMPDEPLDGRFREFPWSRNHDAALRAWQRGQTGIPVVDAGMRQLWSSGWMHNRARMIVGSLLTKNLLIPWQTGQAWFWDTLVDADLANNSMGWQWIQGCGADAAPYFRIFNPVRQAERFDPDGHYVRRWVPELARLPAKHIHAPWEAPPTMLRAAGVRLGKHYPEPVVDLARSRSTALTAYRTMRSRMA